MEEQCQHFMGVRLLLQECLTITIKGRAERCSHGYEPYALEYQRTLPNTKLVRLGAHQRHLAFCSPHLLLGGRGRLAHFAIALPLLLSHCDEKQLSSP